MRAEWSTGSRNAWDSTWNRKWLVTWKMSPGLVWFVVYALNREGIKLAYKRVGYTSLTGTGKQGPKENRNDGKANKLAEVYYLGGLLRAWGGHGEGEGSRVSIGELCLKFACVARIHEVDDMAGSSIMLAPPQVPQKIVE